MRRAKKVLWGRKTALFFFVKNRLPVEFFIQKRVSIRQNTRLRITESAFEPLFCFEKEHPRAITDSDGYELLRAISIRGQFRALNFLLRCCCC